MLIHPKRSILNYVRPHEIRDYEAIPNEKDYDKDVINQYEYSLLALFRYWNVIYYFYPYKYLMDQSWDVTLSEFIPQFLSASDFPSYNNLLVKLITNLNDDHAVVSGLPLKSGNEKYITLIDSLTIVMNKPEGSIRMALKRNGLA